MASTEESKASPPVEEVARRVERFKRSGNSSELWPGLAEQARVVAAREIERVARAVLNGETNVVIDPRDEHDPYALRVAGHTTGVGPLVARWIEEGKVAGDASVRRSFLEQLRHGRLRAERLEREVLPALDALSSRGITPLMLKGFHTSRIYFEEPGLRRMEDVDVWVAPDRVEAAEAALTSAGYRPDSAASRPYRRDWIRTDVDPRAWSLEVPHERSRWILELHASLNRTFQPGAFANFDGERECVAPLVVAGRPVLVLAQPLLLLTLACHCSQELDTSRLLRLVEIVNVIRADLANGSLDWDTVLSMMRRTRSARFAYPAFALVEELAPGTVDPTVLAFIERDSTWAARHTVSRLVPAGGSLDNRGVIRQFMWTRGPISVATRILRLAWPAGFTRPTDLLPGWRARLRRVLSGRLILRAPDERRPPDS
ncbi:MAG: nucleotidyltransferase family protein [bacterium]